jgi:hypothetical protein
MKYTAEMASGAGSDIKKFMGGRGEFTDTQTYRQNGDLISLLLFFSE